MVLTEAEEVNEIRLPFIDVQPLLYSFRHSKVLDQAPPVANHWTLFSYLPSNRGKDHSNSCPFRQSFQKEPENSTLLLNDLAASLLRWSRKRSSAVDYFVKSRSRHTMRNPRPPPASPVSFWIPFKAFVSMGTRNMTA